MIKWLEKSLSPGWPLMSKHISRKDRWTKQNAGQYLCQLGQVVYQQQAWYGIVEYKTLAPRERESDPAAWVVQSLRLGPFKRPRNAMVAVEREAVILKN